MREEMCVCVWVCVMWVWSLIRLCQNDLLLQTR